MTIISSNINVIITHGSKSYGNQFVPATSPLPLSSPHLFRHHCIQQQSQRSTSPPPSSSLSLQVLTPFEWTGKGFDSLRCFGTSRLLHQQIAYMMAIRTKLCGCDLHYFRRQSFAPKARQRIWIKCSSEHSRIRKEREGGRPAIHILCLGIRRGCPHYPICKRDWHGYNTIGGSWTQPMY